MTVHSAAGRDRTFGVGRQRDLNISQSERWASALAGGALMTLGLNRRSPAGALLTLAGGSLLHRAASGRCMLYEAMGIDTSGRGRLRPVASVKHGQGSKFEKSITIKRPAAELFRFWRNFKNLPRFMRHLESVEVLDARRSRWTARGPAGTRIEWEAELYNEREPELIAWRSLPDSDINHAGSVQFRELPGGRGTEIVVSLNYEPPAGRLGQSIARLFGEEPELQIEEDLRRFKQLVEGGVSPTSFGPTAARPSTDRHAPM